MDEILLSVIIPIYNSEKYLKRCIDSVINQLYKNLEIILIDDGSTDGSKQICEELKKIDSRIRYKRIINSGAYQARKIGALSARGDVITFLDADDYIEKDAYINLMNIYSEFLPDVISYCFQINDSGVACENNLECGLYDEKRIQDIVIPRMLFNIESGYRDLNPSVGCKFVTKKLFLEVVNKNEERITWGDDALVTYPMMCIAKKIYIDNHPYYHYFMNDESCTHSFSYNIVDDLKNFKKSLSILLKKYYKNFDWDFQIDNYMRTYAEMLLCEWFNIHRAASMYLFPYHLIEQNSNIKIYGAGEVGKSYVTELLQNRYAKIVGWYDKENYGESYGNILILNPEDIINNDAEYFLIAISNEKIALEVMKNLVDKGISPEKIKWDKPIVRA